jgi:hypothetical protein
MKFYGFIADLFGIWQEEAKLLEYRGAHAVADALIACAGEAEYLLSECLFKEMTLQEAAAKTGYHYTTIKRGLDSGRIKNVGTDKEPRVLLVDLPIEAGYLLRLLGLNAVPDDVQVSEIVLPESSVAVLNSYRRRRPKPVSAIEEVVGGGSKRRHA